MVSENVFYNEFDQESDWDVYGKEYTEYLVENDAINPQEAGFLQGYDDALDEKHNEL